MPSKRIGGGIAVALIAAVVIAGIIGVGLFGDDGSASATAGSGDSNAESQAAASAPSTPETPDTPSPQPTPTQTDTPSPTPAALMAAGSSGDDVRELQARLKQIQWYEPDITGEYDDVTTQAVTGFQEKRGITQTGDVDEATWDRLTDMTEEPTDDELHNRIVAGLTIIGPGDSGDDVRELQARLRQIGWFSGDITPDYGDVTQQSVAGFQTKRGFPSTGEVDERTWDRLVEMTRAPTDDELHNREPESDDSDDGTAALDERCRTGHALCIDKSTNTLRWVTDGSVHMTLDVRFGSELTPTREGAFRVSFKSRDHVSSLYETEMPYAMFFSGGQAVHYSPDFAANGYDGASHGCVNVRDESAIASLFDQVSAGDKVIVYRS